jgi:uncharacterized protein DUF4394
MKSLIRSLVALLAIAPAIAQAETIFGLTTNNRTFRFDSALPGSITNLNGGNPINGLPPNEHLLAIDIRPVAINSPSAASNGVLYALGESGQLYTINTVTGTAIPFQHFPRRSPEPRLAQTLIPCPSRKHGYLRRWQRWLACLPAAAARRNSGRHQCTTTEE